LGDAFRALELGLEAIKENREALNKTSDSQHKVVAFLLRFAFLIEVAGDIEKEMYHRSEPTFDIFDPSLLK
jgi:hypothetical protein